MKKRNKILLSLLSVIMVLASCKKDPEQQDIDKPTLDAHVSFVVKPDPGIDFFLNLYYAEGANEPFWERTADVVLKRVLSLEDIDNGFIIPMEDLKESEFAYVIAFADVDGNGEISEGDIVSCYFEQSLRAVMRGQAQADNVAHREFLTIEMEEIYSTSRTLDVNFTFPIEPAAGTELILNLYSSQQEELDFLSRLPDIVRKHTLTEEDISGGYKITVDNLDDDLPYLYAVAYVDMNGDGEVSYGDVAVVHDSKAVHSVLAGNATANNISSEIAITMEMNHLYIDPNEEILVKDIDGNIYTTVVIGDKEWLVENLKVTRYNDGTSITTDLSDTDWASTTEGAYAVYPHGSTTTTDYPVASEADMIAQFGLLYNGYALADPRGLAPEGWRIATDVDFQELEALAGVTNLTRNGWATPSYVGDKLRSKQVWSTPGTDDFGVDMLPAGSRTDAGVYAGFGTQGDLWTSTTNPAGTQLFRRLLRIGNVSGNNQVGRSPGPKNIGYVVRCVRDL